MLGINKITVSDQFDDRGNNVYVVEVDYYFETTKDEFGLPSLDLSRSTQLYANFESPSNTILRQSLSYPTFIGNGLNPDLQKIENGYRYPFTVRFNVDAEESLDFTFEFQLYKKTSPYDRETRITLFSGGDLEIENEDNIPIEDQRTNFYDNIFNFDLFDIGSTPNNSSVSELMVSYGKDKSVKGMFIFDKQKFISNNSDFGKILKNSNMPLTVKREIMNKSVVDNIEITRKRVSYIKNFKNNPHDADVNEVPQTVAQGTDSSSGTLSSSTGKLAELRDLSLSDITYEKLIAFKDDDTLQGGTYQYSLQMRIQDGILGWLIDTLDKLTKMQSTLGRQTGRLATIAELRGIVRVLFTLNEDINMTQATLISYLRNMVRHQGSLLLLKSYMTNLINKISNLIGKAGVISQTNSAYSKVYSKSNSELFFLTFGKVFTTTANCDDAIDLNYDYMGLEPDSSVGATIVSRGDMQRRASAELQKLLKAEPSDGYGNLSQSIFGDVFNFVPASDSPAATLQLAYFNFQPNLYAYFSPVRIDDVSLTLSNTFNFKVMNRIHFRQKYDDNLTPQLSVSYYLQSRGVSLGEDFFLEDPPLQDAKIGQTYLPANAVFSDSDRVNTRSSTVENYLLGIIAPPESNASDTFASMFLRNEENWNLSREDFDITNSENLLSSVSVKPPKSRAPTGPVASQELSIVREMPNQIRAIFASPSDKCVNQWLSPSIEGDYIYSPTTYYTIKQNYMNLVKVEYLDGFKKDSNGLPDVRNPIFKKLTDLNGTGKIICRASIYNDARFRIGVGFDRIAYPDKYFILDLTE